MTGINHVRLVYLVKCIRGLLKWGTSRYNTTQYCYNDYQFLLITLYGENICIAMLIVMDRFNSYSLFPSIIYYSLHDISVFLLSTERVSSEWRPCIPGLLNSMLVQPQIAINNVP